MASSKKKTKAKVKKAVVENTDIKRVVLEKLLKEKQEEIQKKVDLVKKIKSALQIESKKISELEGAILALHEVLTGNKVE